MDVRFAKRLNSFRAGTRWCRGSFHASSAMLCQVPVLDIRFQFSESQSDESRVADAGGRTLSHSHTSSTLAPLLLLFLSLAENTSKLSLAGTPGASCLGLKLFPARTRWSRFTTPSERRWSSRLCSIIMTNCARRRTMTIRGRRW